MNVNDNMRSRPTVDNPNTWWARIFVDELARCGLRDACVAPGSRSTPLTLALYAHQSIRVHLHLDERSAAFFGLGMALAQDVPVALVCTSGTAAINFHPAVVEARYSHVPLLVLTADRPPELRHSGANQTIDQIRMYGEHVLWSVDVALPEANAPAVAVRNLRTLAARAFAKANGLLKGPVHLNFPFRKPLEPVQGNERSSSSDEKSTARSPSAFSSRQERHDQASGPGRVDKGDLGPTSGIVEQRVISSHSTPLTRVSRGVLAPTRQQVDALRKIIDGAERGLIVCGPRCPGGEFPELASALSRLTGYPIFADALSGLRFGQHLEEHTIIGAYESFLAGGEPPWQEPEVVIRFGAVPTSKSLNSYLDNINLARRVHISSSGEWADDTHRITDLIHADATLTSKQLTSVLLSKPASNWTKRILDVEVACWQAIDDVLGGEYFDGVVLADTISALPGGTSLFAGNSLPVRHLDQFGRPQAKSIDVYANRGASGIDGNISSALGVCAARKTPLVAVLGDITFYHDLNGLRTVKEFGLDVTIVLLNNNGGGIFHRLPVSQYEPPFTDLFLTPHGLDFEPAARMYDLDFVRVEDRASFQAAFADSMKDRRPRVIEVRSDSAQDYARWREVVASVRERLRERFETALP